MKNSIISARIHTSINRQCYAEYNTDLKITKSSVVSNFVATLCLMMLIGFNCGWILIQSSKISAILILFQDQALLVNVKFNLIARPRF